MPHMSWTPVEGAHRYKVKYAVGASISYTYFADATDLPYPSFAHTESLLGPGTYSFIVEAFNNLGVEIDDTEDAPRTFVIDALGAASLLGPANCVSLPCEPLADTPTFTWSPVPNAGLYLLYLATDPNFNNIVKRYQTEHTSLTPRESLPDSNAGQSYYWFVSPCKATGACGPFEPPYTGRFAFEKRSAAIQIISPAHDTTVTGPVTFTWKDFLQTNQELATKVTQEARTYRIQVSRFADFSVILDEAVVDQTTYTPHALNRTYPDGPLYWRVQAIDASQNSLTFSYVGSPGTHHKVTKDQAEVTQHDVADGSITLSWDAQPFATKYDVEIYKNGDTAWSPGNLLAAGYSGNTKVAAWTPTKAFEAGTYAWRVRRVDNLTVGPTGSGTAVNNDDWSTGKTFTVGAPAPVLVAPDNSSPEVDSRVLFDWDAVVGAASYRVEIATSSAFATPIENITTVMTEYANTKTLPAGTIYWRVTPLNADGKPMGPSASRTIRRVVTGDFFSLPPSRILDTRSVVGKVPGGTSIDLQVSGAGGVPEEHVTAVVLNVTATSSTTNGYITVWPTGGAKPTASNLNYIAGQTVPNLVKVKLGEGGKVSIYNSAGATHVIADVAGYYTDGVPTGGSTLTPLNSTRLLNTVTTGGAITSGTSRELLVTGVGGVPATGVGAVAVNVTSSGSASNGYLTVYPKGVDRPTASNLNFVKGITISNLVIAKVGTGGRIMLYTSGVSTHVQVDVVGWYSNGTQGAGTHFNSLTPSRVLDTRTSGGALGAAKTRTVKVTGIGGVPTTGVQAVVLNVTAIGSTATGYLSVYPGTTRPVGASVNFPAKRNVPNLVIVKVSGGNVTLYNHLGTTNAVFDVVGWFG
jgi:hypothetical protein